MTTDELMALTRGERRLHAATLVDTNVIIDLLDRETRMDRLVDRDAD